AESSCIRWHHRALDSPWPALHVEQAVCQHHLTNDPLPASYDAAHPTPPVPRTVLRRALRPMHAGLRNSLSNCSEAILDKVPVALDVWRNVTPCVALRRKASIRGRIERYRERTEIRSP